MSAAGTVCRGFCLTSLLCIIKRQKVYEKVKVLNISHKTHNLIALLIFHMPDMFACTMAALYLPYPVRRACYYNGKFNIFSLRPRPPSIPGRYFSLRRARLKHRHSEGGNRAMRRGSGLDFRERPSKFSKKRENTHCAEKCKQCQLIFCFITIKLSTNQRKAVSQSH